MSNSEKVTWDTTKVFQCRCGVTAMPLTDDTECKCKDIYEQEWNLVDVCQCKEPSFTTPRGRCFNCQCAARPANPRPPLEPTTQPVEGPREPLYRRPLSQRIAAISEGPVSALSMPLEPTTAIPEDLKQLYSVHTDDYGDSNTNSEIAGLIERIGRAESALAAMREERDRLKNAIIWADGRGDDFRERGPKEGAYWWRKELMQRAGMSSRPVSPSSQPE
jgi:hypothetical protein